MTFAHCWHRAILCAAAVLLLAPAAPAQGKGAKKEDQEFAKQVNEAIDKGVKYLRGLQNADDGTWPGANVHQLGLTSLAGLALLEAGVPGNDPAIRKAAAAVRKLSIDSTYNYSIAVAIMFLDRLGDPQDVPFIDALAVRLLSSQAMKEQGWAGGWGYLAPDPDATEIQRLNHVLKNRKDTELPKDAKRPKPRSPEELPKEIQDQIKRLYSVGPPPKYSVGSVDNSNTQFALIALWAARRHGLPVERAIALADHRLRRTQATNGGWAYQSGSAALSPQMTCCGLIGLGLGYGMAADAKGSKAARKDMSKDQAVVFALKAVAAVVGEPATDPAKIPRIPQGQGGKLFYTLWTLERMAVLYDIKKFGKKDWYKWGAQILIANQGEDGSWAGEYHHGGADTCFALLFLKRANLTPDLTERMRKDPNRPKLLEGIEAAPRGGAAPSRGPGSNPAQPRPQQSLLGYPLQWRAGGVRASGQAPDEPEASATDALPNPSLTLPARRQVEL
jgi:hypothetical protein